MFHQMYRLKSTILLKEEMEHRCSIVNFPKFFRKKILQITCEWLLWWFLSSNDRLIFLILTLPIKLHASWWNPRLQIHFHRVDLLILYTLFHWKWKTPIGAKAKTNKQENQQHQTIESVYFQFSGFSVFLRFDGPNSFFAKALRKRPKFSIISRCGNFVEAHSFHTRKLGEITVFYAMKVPLQSFGRTLNTHLPFAGS